MNFWKRIFGKQSLQSEEMAEMPANDSKENSQPMNSPTRSAPCKHHYKGYVALEGAMAGCFADASMCNLKQQSTEDLQRVVDTHKSDGIVYFGDCPIEKSCPMAMDGSWIYCGFYDPQDTE